MNKEKIVNVKGVDFKLISSSEKQQSTSLAKAYIYRPVKDIEKEAKEEKINKEKEKEKLANLNKMNDLKIKIKKEEK